MALVFILLINIDIDTINTRISTSPCMESDGQGHLIAVQKDIRNRNKNMAMKKVPDRLCVSGFIYITRMNASLL